MTRVSTAAAAVAALALAQSGCSMASYMRGPRPAGLATSGIDLEASELDISQNMGMDGSQARAMEGLRRKIATAIAAKVGNDGREPARFRVKASMDVAVWPRLACLFLPIFVGFPTTVTDIDLALDYQVGETRRHAMVKRRIWSGMYYNGGMSPFDAVMGAALSDALDEMNGDQRALSAAGANP